ncbi:DUF1810 domain-containing protein [Mucilaginibacter jinjuensis]|uniref:DUF1810 domain-containing protein n=1 Tax=Mucilaginibacter jinjuensis TaxID=1176721 RepID=A0ABY7TGI9_9SPHI|nr:DUF1810 domain-containing protein [Mucilaginibacter jinjuensis]WCT14697.1 DUF1810 domain-containing protein [Mucilaginibacter jinjuensis]
MHYNLKRFTEAQERDYELALAEIKNGRKQSHWIWYIFPQIKGLGSSDISKFYAINRIEEAEAYLKDPVLGNRLIEISQELLNLPDDNATDIFGTPDDLKLRSSMTLFASVPGSPEVFQNVLDKFFDGVKDDKTVQILSEI